MGFFDRLFGKAESPITEPDRLRSYLLSAVQSGDARRLECLARANEATVIAHFDSWKKVPDQVRVDASATKLYVHSLITIAQLFAARLGRPELMDSLTGPDDANPIMKWQAALRQSRGLLDDLRYDEARSILADALIDALGMSGTGVDSLLPITQGYLAEAYFHAGRAPEAVPHLENALAACERSGDVAGIIAYLSSLFEVHRYLAQPGLAAGYADRLASMTPDKDTSRWQTRARIVRAGEPLNRVVAVVDGATIEVDEVRHSPDVRVRFVFERNRTTLRPAEVLVARGEQLGIAGREEEALTRLEEAAAADPFDPHSRYLAAFNLLLLGRYAEGADGYRRVEELAPGWFHCRADAWMADQLVGDRLTHEGFLTLTQLQDGKGSPEEKLALSEQLTNLHPALPIGHLLRGKALATLGRKAEARAALKAGLSYEPESDVRTRLLVDLALLTEDRAERGERLQEAIVVSGNLVAAATAVILLRGG